MARKTKMEQKKIQVEEFKPLSGKAADSIFSIKKNEITKRFDFHKDGGLILSDVSSKACLEMSEKYNVQWEQSEEN